MTAPETAPLPPDAPWIVLKFGGTSVASVERWRTILELAAARRAEGARVLVVVSALSGITDALRTLCACAPHERVASLEAIGARHRELAVQMHLARVEAMERWLTSLSSLVRVVSIDPLGWQAAVQAHGELLSSSLGAAYMGANGLNTTWLDAREALQARGLPFLNERARALSAQVEAEHNPAFADALARRGEVFITQGFIARDTNGNTVLLGRGGSDTSAAYFGALLRAQRVEIWTDVAGMFTADPRQVPGARLLQRLDYEEAQEIATTGAKVLHPRCLSPLRRARVPLVIKDTQRPQLEGTAIGPELREEAPSIKAISSRCGITLVSMETVGMWQQVGFLADVFALFKQHGLSVDLIGSAETNVTVSLDPTENLLDSDALAALAEDLAKICRVKVIAPCAAVTLVGRGMRSMLHRLSGVLAEFGQMRVHLISQSSNNLNITFVVDEEMLNGLLPRLHELLIRAGALRTDDTALFGPSWRSLYGARAATAREPWWRKERARLLELASSPIAPHPAEDTVAKLARPSARQATPPSASCLVRAPTQPMPFKASAERAGSPPQAGGRKIATPRYIYHLPTVRERARALRGLQAVDRVYYAVKANPHPAILRAIALEGIGFECVSPGELAAVDAIPEAHASPLLFTPNFAPYPDYELAWHRGVSTTLDALHPLQHWPELFASREIMLRVDLGRGLGHHDKVRTGGQGSKFGLPLDQLDAFIALAEKNRTRTVGLHAHLGSGILDVSHWSEVYGQLASLAERVGSVAYLNIGGGLGVPAHPGELGLDLTALGAALNDVKQAYPQYKLWLEPGRWLVADAGVLLARVTQIKRKGALNYLGCDAGMHALIRPALYDAWHEIVNLSRLDQKATTLYQIVGPICESGDVLGAERRLPQAREGDALLIAQAGAYGESMASRYNLRQLAESAVIE